MSAKIPDTMLLSDLLKPTGYDCPDALIGKTMAEIVAGVADLENNKAVTIDASTYTDPVEIIPTEGKDGMKKVTVTLTGL